MRGAAHHMAVPSHALTTQSQTQAFAFAQYVTAEHVDVVADSTATTIASTRR